MKTPVASGTIADRLRTERRSTFVGREVELEQLLRCLGDDRAVVTFVIGLGGIGKTRLLGAFGDRLQDRGVPFRCIDCESVPPTAAGFLGALGEVFGRALPSVGAAAEAIAELGPRLVLACDQYEKFRLIDGWLRQELLPALPAGVRLFLFARDAAVDAWKSTPGWAALVEILRLGPLDEMSALELLEQRGAPAPVRARLARLTRGHPLALELAARGLEERFDSVRSDVESEQVIQGLASMFLREVHDALRPVLEAACLARRATKSVLAAMVPEVFDDSQFDAMRSLPFVTLAPDGLVIHETVRAAVAASLRALDPPRYQALRGRAWLCLRRELEHAGKQQLWRYMADALYLADRPEIRDAFFPGDSKIYGLEDARPGDESAVLELVRAHDSSDLDDMRSWWSALPGAFRISRDGAGRVRAFAALSVARDIPAELAARDPIVKAWNEHLRADGVPADRPVLFSRRTLIADTGEEPSALRSAVWLDAKRLYLEYPELRRVYLATRNPDDYLSSLASLGFEAPASLRIRCGDGVLTTLVLDVGARGVWGWLARLVDAQFEAPLIDESARALSVDGRSVPLTKLEFEAIRYLFNRRETVVSRDDLLRDVWGQSFGGSNVVDAVVRSLRKKLGARSSLIETVTGHGYRLSFSQAERFNTSISG